MDDEPMSKGRIAVLVAVTVVVLAIVAGGVTWAWRSYFGPTPASAADCRLAQQLFDRATTMPSDPAKAQALDTEIRQIRYTQMKDEGLSTQVGLYSRWQVTQKTGQGIKPTPERWNTMKSEADGHCSGSGVKLKIHDL